MSTEMSRHTIADIVREELNSEETLLNIEHEELVRQLREVNLKLAQVTTEREAIRLTRIRMFRRYVEDDEFSVDADAVAERIVLDQEEAQAVFGTDPEEPEPEPAAAEETAPDAKAGGEARAEQLRSQGEANRSAVEAAAKEMGAFTNKRLAETVTLAPATVGDYVRRMMEDGIVFRGSKQERGTKVYFVHRDYKGEHSFEMASGESTNTPAEVDVSRVRDWVIKAGEANPFTPTKIADDLHIDPLVVRTVLDILAVRQIVKAKPMGRFEYLPPTRRAA